MSFILRRFFAVTNIDLRATLSAIVSAAGILVRRDRLSDQSKADQS